MVRINQFKASTLILFQVVDGDYEDNRGSSSDNY